MRVLIREGMQKSRACCSDQEMETYRNPTLNARLQRFPESMGQDGLWLGTHASTGDIFAFTLRREFSKWSDRAGGCQGGLASLRGPFV